MVVRGRLRAGANGRIAPIVAAAMALAMLFALVVGVTSGLNCLRLPVDQGPIGTAVEAAEFDSLPFGKLAEETVGEEARDGESEKDGFDDAALGQLEYEASAPVRLLIGERERPSSSRARALLGMIGARGPPLG